LQLLCGPVSLPPPDYVRGGSVPLGMIPAGEAPAGTTPRGRRLARDPCLVV